MPSSREWREYFEHNAQSLLEIPWQQGAELTDEEREAIARSLREFQAGESSEGRHLMAYARRYAEQTGDHDYVPALRLFIGEEQRHSRDLARFLLANGIPLVPTTPTDTVFRWMRNLLGNLEVSIAVLITAELIARVYYAALRDATESVVLRRLCEQILRDELRHVQFQAEQLSRLQAGRLQLGLGLTSAAQRILMLGTILVVWPFHRRALKRGGMNFFSWWSRCWAVYQEAFAAPVSAAELA